MIITKNQDQNSTQLLTSEFSSKENSNLFQTTYFNREDEIKCYFSKNNITKLFLVDLADFAADLNQLISLPCSPNNKKSTGSTFYRCQSDGNFHYVNSTCISVETHQLEVYILKFRCRDHGISFKHL